MAGVEETLILADASVEEQVVAALQSLDLTPAELHYEPANDFPGQTFAIDLHGQTSEHLDQLIRDVRATLAEIDIARAPTTLEYEQSLRGAPLT